MDADNVTDLSQETFEESVRDDDLANLSRALNLLPSHTNSSQSEKTVQKETNLSHVLVGQGDAMDKLGDIVPKSALVVDRVILDNGYHTEPDSVAGAEKSHSPLSSCTDALDEKTNPAEVQKTSETPHVNGGGGHATSEKICEAKDCGLRCEKMVAEEAGVFLQAVVDHPSRCIQDVLENTKKRGDEGYYSYQLMGECYVHGMMDGEAMLYQNEEDIYSAVFEIR